VFKQAASDLECEDSDKIFERMLKKIAKIPSTDKAWAEDGTKMSYLVRSRRPVGLLRGNRRD
jgi:hypothetical protein